VSSASVQAESQHYSGSGRLGLAELTRAYRASHGFRGRLWVVSVLGAGSAVIFGLSFELPWWQALSVFVLVWFSAWRLPARLARGHQRRAGTSEVSYRLNQQGAFESRPPRHVEWSQARALRETEAAYVFDVPGQLPFVLPKAAFSKENVQEIQGFLHARVALPAAVTPRATVALVAAVAVAVVWFVVRSL